MTVVTSPRPLVATSIPVRPPRTRTLGIRAIATSIGVGAMLVSFAGSWIPSFWGDEAASIMSAERPLPSLFAMLGRIDAVHGAYYLFLHGWIALFGASEFSVRLPSAIGIGLAAAGTVILGNLLFGRRLAIIAGVVLAVLPRVTNSSIEARSYALGMAMAVWLTVLLVVLLSRGIVSRLAWLGYAVVFAAAIYLFLYLILLAVVHGAFVIASTRSRGIRRGWMTAVGIGTVLAAPVLVWGMAEHNQIAFLARRYHVSFATVFVQQWFGGFWVAVLSWLLIVIGAIWVIRSDIANRRGPAVARTRLPGTSPMGAVLAIAWLVLPTAILLVGHAVAVPMYTIRYLTFCAPAVALLIAAGVTALPSNWMRASAIAILIGLVVPGYLAQRGQYAMDGGSDWRQVSAIVGAHAQPGDAIVFGLASRPSRMPRLAMGTYPADYRGLDNVELITPFAESPGLRDEVAPLGAVDARLSGSTRVWAVDPLPKAGRQTTDVVNLERLGFRLVQSYRVHRNGVYELTREIP